MGEDTSFWKLTARRRQLVCDYSFFFSPNAETGNTPNKLSDCKFEAYKKKHIFMH